MAKRLGRIHSGPGETRHQPVGVHESRGTAVNGLRKTENALGDAACVSQRPRILPEIPGGYGTGTDNFATFADGKSHTDATLYPNDNGQAMKRKDLIVIVCALALLSPFFLFPSVYEFYKEFNAQYGMVMSFIKFALLSTFGECIGLRITHGDLQPPRFSALHHVRWCGAFSVWASAWP